LLSQDNALKQAAQVLADSFTVTFNAKMLEFMNSNAYDLAGLVTPDLSGFDATAGAGGARGGVMFNVASAGNAKIFEVNINAGMVADKAELGQTIVDSIVRYERTNGSIWARAIA
jgi:hypothetical protein